MNNWIKVEDRLPEVGVRVLVYSAGIADDIRWDIGFRLVPVTPWMPMPEPPVSSSHMSPGKAADDEATQ